MKRYIVEEIDYKGMQYAILLQDLGHRCGYINVYYTPLKGVEYIDVTSDLYVHGGFTYSSDKLVGVDVKDAWWLGWDYAHFGDGIDKEALYTKICENEQDMREMTRRLSFQIVWENDTVYTQEMVRNDIKQVIDNLLEYYNPKE